MAFGAGIFLTNDGRVVLARAQTGDPLIFKRLQVGDGELSGQQPAERTSLVSPKLYVPLSRLRVNVDATVTVGGKMDNALIGAGFYLREIGVWVQDPDNAEAEILYAYGNADDGAQYISAAGGAEVIEKTINVVMVIGNASNVSASIASGQSVTPEDLEAAIAAITWEGINNKPSAYPPSTHTHADLESEIATHETDILALKAQMTDANTSITTLQKQIPAALVYAYRNIAGGF
jgi:hypothetical protein